jgi:hypothetical protein
VRAQEREREQRDIQQEREREREKRDIQQERETARAKELALTCARERGKEKAIEDIQQGLGFRV